MSETKSIWIITQEEDSHSSELSDPKETTSNQKTQVSVEQVKESLSNFCDTVEVLFEEAEKSLLLTRVNEIEVFVKIDQQGEINLLSTADEADIKGAIKLTFKRNKVKLENEEGINYRKLRDLLALEKWQEADTETNNLMCQIADRREEGMLTEEDLLTFPIEELRMINKLWLHYSQRRFGFSIQAKIYRSLGGTQEYDNKLWENFGDKVGWRKEGKWLQWADYDFKLDQDTPRGHLPTPGGMGGRIGGLIPLLSRHDL